MLALKKYYVNLLRSNRPMGAPKNLRVRLRQCLSGRKIARKQQNRQHYVSHLLLKNENKTVFHLRKHQRAFLRTEDFQTPYAKLDSHTEKQALLRLTGTNAFRLPSSPFRAQKQHSGHHQSKRNKRVPPQKHSEFVQKNSAQHNTEKRKHHPIHRYD